MNRYSEHFWKGRWKGGREERRRGRGKEQIGEESRKGKGKNKRGGGVTREEEGGG